MPALAIIQWFLSPIGRYVALALVVIAAYTTWDLSIRHDERVKINQEQKVETQHAVEKGTTARDRAVKRFDSKRLRDDGFARD